MESTTDIDKFFCRTLSNVEPCRQ